MSRVKQNTVKTRSADRRVPSTVFHRGIGFAVPKDFARSRSARKYRQSLANGEYADLIAELEQVERDLQSRPAGWSDEPSTRQRSGLPLWKRLCLVWDFSPRERYAAQFLNSTRRRLATRDEETRLLASPDPKDREKAKKARAERREAERALRVLMRLLFESEWLVRGRKRQPPTRLPPDVKAERKRLLAELQASPREKRSAAARRILARELPTRADKLTRKLDRLLERKIVRPVDVINQFLAWKYRTRPAAIQAVAAPAPEPPDILHG